MATYPTQQRKKPSNYITDPRTYRTFLRTDFPGQTGSQASKYSYDPRTGYSYLKSDYPAVSQQTSRTPTVSSGVAAPRERPRTRTASSPYYGAPAPATRISSTAKRMPTYRSIDEWAKARGLFRKGGGWYSDPGTQVMTAEAQFRQYQASAKGFNKRLGSTKKTQSQLDYYTREQARNAEEAQERAEEGRERALGGFEDLRRDFQGEEFVGDIYDRETQANIKRANEAITRRYEAGGRGRAGAADEERMNASMRIQREGLIDKALAEYRARQDQRGFETDIATRIAGLLGSTSYKQPDYSDVIAQLVGQGGEIGNKTQRKRTTTAGRFGGV